MHYNLRYLLFFLLGFGLLSCGNEEAPVRSNTIGVMKMSVDETLYPLIHQAVLLMKSDYPKAVIYDSYVPGQKAIKDIMEDSAMLAITTRSLTDSEMKSFLEAYQYTPTISKIAIDAVALIVNEKNPHKSLLKSQIIDILQGNISDWDEVNAEGSSTMQGEINIAFDNPYSSTVKAMKEYTGIESIKNPNAAALRSNADVIKYVSNNPNAIGIVGMNWISQKASENYKKARKQIAVVAIGNPVEEGEKQEYFKPSAENIKSAAYTLIRRVYVINRGQNISLGTGFSSFLNSPRGQLLIEKCGLVPIRETPQILYLEDGF